MVQILVWSWVVRPCSSFRVVANGLAELVVVQTKLFGCWSDEAIWLWFEVMVLLDSVAVVEGIRER